MTTITEGTTTKHPEEASFLEQARAVVAKKHDKVYATWYDVQGNPTNEYTFGKLWEEAGVIAHHLRTDWKIEKGQKVVLCYNFGLHFFAAFLGCLRAGVICVLTYPPGPPLKKSLTKMIHVIEDCQPAAILTDSDIVLQKQMDILNPLSNSRNLWPSKIAYRKTDGLWRRRGFLTSSRPSFDDESISLQDIAFLQYTSGSTGAPKGVIISHRNLTANIRLLRNGHNHTRDAADLERDHVGFSWLPEYHDLGLIYASISPFAEGWRMHMCSPVSFIQNPLLWMKLISKHRIRWSVAPNFGYKLVVRKYLEAKAHMGGRDPLPGLDLSCIHHFQNAAEPIGLDTRQTFWDCFRDYGLRENWFTTGYGLAENVVGVSFFHGYKTSRPRPGQDTSEFLAVGRRGTFDTSVTVKIVDPKTRQEVDDEVTGELWIAGASKAVGYLNKPEHTQEVFQAKLEQDVSSRKVKEEQGFLRTGDLAFFQDDCLFICGRIKDLIIINGVNYYPHDLEYTGQGASSDVRPGCIAAFSPDESADSGTEVVVVFEIRKHSEGNAAEVCAAVRDAISQGVGLTPTSVVAIQERNINKTTSGKIQRRKTRQMLQDGLLPIVYKLQLGCDKEVVSITSDSTLEDLPVEETYDLVLASVFGAGYDPSMTWDQNGMSSMMLVELSNQLSENFPIILPPDFPEKFRTPNDLKDFILGPSTGAFFPVQLDADLKGRKTQGRMAKPIPRMLCTFLQGVGIIALLLIISVSTVPAFHFVRHCDDEDRAWLKVFLPLALPIWHLTFTLLLVGAKWIVIGRYSTQEVAVPSIYFLRWWFVDRAIDTWETLTGRFVLNTPLIWLFYRLMGTNMPSSVKVDAFVRDFDLIQVGHAASIERGIQCRKFGPWEKSIEDTDGNPTLRFRPTIIAAHCTIRGHVELGASIGEGSRVDKLAAVPEGAQVPAGVVAVGSPAFHGPEPAAPHYQDKWSFLLGFAKLLWILVVLYTSAFYYVIGGLVFSVLRQSSWRYAPVAYAAVLVAFSTCLGLLACIVLKWLLVGRRRPGINESEFRKLCHWMADYYYGIYRSLFDLVGVNTFVVNFILKAMGMDIDFESKVWLFLFPPSKVDLVTVKRSFVSNFDLDLSVDGKAQRVTVEDSSIGHSVVVRGGTTVQNYEISPMQRVTENLIGDSKKASTREPMASVNQRILGDLATPLLALTFVATFIPAYEFFNLQLVGNKLDVVSFPVVRLAVALAIHTLSWGLACFIFEWAVLAKGEDGNYRSKPRNTSLYVLYLTIMDNFCRYSLISILWGSQFGNVILAGFGWDITGPLWCFGFRWYDSPLISVRGPTIIDSTLIDGHAVVYGNFEIGTCQLAGVIHPGTLCMANTRMPEGDGTQEIGPIIYVTPTAKATQSPPAATAKATQRPVDPEYYDV